MLLPLPCPRGLCFDASDLVWPKYSYKICEKKINDWDLLRQPLMVSSCQSSSRLRMTLAPSLRPPKSISIHAITTLTVYWYWHSSSRISNMVQLNLISKTPGHHRHHHLRPSHRSLRTNSSSFHLRKIPNLPPILVNCNEITNWCSFGAWIQFSFRIFSKHIQSRFNYQSKWIRFCGHCSHRSIDRPTTRWTWLRFAAATFPQ